VLSVYTVLNFIAITGGQLTFNLAPSTEWVLFGVSSILISLAIIPIAFTLSLQPAPVSGIKVYVFKLWKLSKIGMFGAIISGLATGGFWSMGALYARSMGLDAIQLTIFMSAVVLGGALFQFPLGRLSDFIDRRKIVCAAAVIGFIASLALTLMPDIPAWAIISLGFVWGGGALTLYAICLAHANDHASADEFLAVGSGMLMIMGVSSATGAYAASWFIAWLGPKGLFVFSAVALSFLILATLIRTRTQEPPEHDESATFRPVAATSPVALELDPRTELDETATPERS
jgi:MFS family permease